MATALPPSPPKLEVDYLVVGAGAAGMSFIDTLLAEHPTATVVLVDRNSEAGGHWTTTYAHVKLHQPSCFYGVNSLQLGKVLDRKGNERYDLDDRATGGEVVEYYRRVTEQFRRSRRVQIFFESEYSVGEDGTHCLTDMKHGSVRHVTCIKVVRIRSNVMTPALRKGELPFPVAPEMKDRVICVNDLSKHVKESMSSQFSKQYYVVGAGKTGTDAVLYLLESGVDASQIHWIVSRDVWFFVRDGYIKPGLTYWQNVNRVVGPLGKQSSLREAFIAFEKDGMVARLNPKEFPPVFKGSAVSAREMSLLRRVQDVVRLGRVTAILKDSMELEKGTLSLPEDACIVDCVANTDRDFYGYNACCGRRIYNGNEINLGPLFITFNPSFSAAITAFLEVHLEDDEVKNGMLYFPTGTGFEYSPIMFFSMFFAQFKTSLALSQYTPALMFFVNSRLNVDSPQHHRGVLRFLWAAIGPLGIKRKGDRFAKKYASGGYSDAHLFGCDRPYPSWKTIRKAKRKVPKRPSKGVPVYPPPNE